MSNLSQLAREIADAVDIPGSNLHTLLFCWNVETCNAGRPELQFRHNECFQVAHVVARLRSIADRLDATTMGTNDRHVQVLASHTRFPEHFCQMVLNEHKGKFFPARDRLMEYVREAALAMDTMISTGQPQAILDTELREWCVAAGERWAPRRHAIREAAFSYKDAFADFSNSPASDAYPDFTHECIGWLHMMDEANRMDIIKSIREQLAAHGIRKEDL